MFTSKSLSVETDCEGSGARDIYLSSLRRRSYQGACLVMFAMLLCASGCTTNATLPDPARDASIIAYMSDLRQTTSTLLDKVVVALPNAGVDHLDYTSWTGDWCPRHERVHSVDDVQGEISRYCRNAGGIYNNAFCQRATDHDEVLFYAEVLREGNCQQVANPVGVHIIEPKSGKIRSRSYLAALHQVGYLTDAEMVAANAAILRELQAEQDRAARELPRLRTRGTRVCKKEPAITFVGFVEDVSGPKIRINIQTAYYNALSNGQGLSSRAENYQPQMVWDMPENWRVCE
jgi:hypothetical protein